MDDVDGVQVEVDEVEVEVPYGDDPAAVATRLMAAAREAGLDQSLIRTSAAGVFLVPASLAAAAKPTSKSAAKKA